MKISIFIVFMALLSTSCTDKSINELPNSSSQDRKEQQQRDYENQQELNKKY